MIKKILPLLLPVVAALGGAVAGDMLGGGGQTEVAAAEAPADAAAADGHGAPAADAQGAEPAAEAHAAPAEEAHAAPAEDAHAAPADDGHGGGGGGGHGEDPSSATEGFFRFPSQFFVPVVRNGRTDSIMIMTVTLETEPGGEKALARQEHRLRDSLLRSLMIHANTGGFDGNFTSDSNIGFLRESLLKSAQTVAGEGVTAVLIEDIARKEG